MSAKDARKKTKTYRPGGMIEWTCTGCQKVRKSAPVPGTDKTIIRCKGNCFTETVHTCAR